MKKKTQHTQSVKKASVNVYFAVDYFLFLKIHPNLFFAGTPCFFFVLHPSKMTEQEEATTAVKERAACSECGNAHHKGSIIVWLEHKVHDIEKFCHNKGGGQHAAIVVGCVHPPARLTMEEVSALASNVMCLAKSKKSTVEVDQCSGEPVCPKYSVCVYVPDDRTFGKGAWHVVHAEGAPFSSIEISRASAFTAFANSSESVAVTTNDLLYLTDQYKPWEGFDQASKSIGSNVSRVPGGIPLYRGGKLIGGLGVAGPDASKAHELAIKAAGECFGIPAKLKEKMDAVVKASEKNNQSS
jgi:uncharacterized protein GlcG (DUF336 family)